MSWADTRRRGIAAGLAVAALLASAVVAAPAASAEEVYYRPANGIVQLAGHGWGHGHGMSQWGAEGAALAGKSWQYILGFYYPGSALRRLPDSPIRVCLDDLSPGTASGACSKAASAVAVAYGKGLQVQAAGATSPLQLPATIGTNTVTKYQMRPVTPGKVQLYYNNTSVAGGWSKYGAALAAPAVLSNPTGASLSMLLPTGSQRPYAGALVLNYTASGLVPVLRLSMENYVRNVVPAEVYLQWRPDALAAQAVAVRTYAQASRIRATNRTWDICDTTWCQKFSGVAAVDKTWQANLDAGMTASSEYALYDGTTPITAQFSASNGGWTAAGGASYLVAKADPYDDTSGNPNHSWNTSVSAAKIETTWPAIGTYQKMRITQRDGHGEWGGRVTELYLDGSKGSVRLTGTGFQSALGLKAEWFRPTNSGSFASFPKDLTGDHKADVVGVLTATGQLQLYPGNGAGRFQPARVIGTSGWGAMTAVLTAGTWDADPLSDVLARKKDGTLWFYPATGTGLGAPRLVGSGWQGFNTIFATGDFDGDGLSDIAARHTDDGTLWLYKGNGQGAFTTKRLIGSGWGSFTTVLSPGDLDGDGHPDVIARTMDGRLILYPGDGKGGWLTKRQVSTGWASYTALMSAGDFNGDGKGDLLARSSDGVLWLYRGTGSGTFFNRVAVGTGWNALRILP